MAGDKRVQIKPTAVLVAVAVLALLLAIPTYVAGQETEIKKLVTVKAVPVGLPLKLGDELTAAEMTLTEPRMEAGPVGPYPVFINDFSYHAEEGGQCSWSEAAASGISEWFGLNVRGDPCAAFQHSIAAVSSAGGDGNIVGNNAGGAPVEGTAGGTIPGVMIGQDDGLKMVDTINALTDPMEFRVLLEIREVVVKESLPPPPEGYRPPPSSGGGGFGQFGSFGDDGFGDFGFNAFGEEETEEPEVITVPGRTGEDVEFEIPTYAEAAAEQTGLNPLIPVTVSVVVLAFLLGGFFFIRSRRQEEAEGLY